MAVGLDESDNWQQRHDCQDSQQPRSPRQHAAERGRGGRGRLDALSPRKLGMTEML